MRLSTLLRTVFGALVLPALIATFYLYLYPAAHGCAFPKAKPSNKRCLEQHIQSSVPPFRLLVLGDPQLEGDTSLPNPDAPLFPSLRGVEGRLRDGDWDGLKHAIERAIKKDLAKVQYGYRKKLDLWGNDLYLAHIYRSVSWWTQPTHTIVLGDLLGSQWIGDEEFRRRTDRFWSKVFKGGEKVPDTITDAEGTREALEYDVSWKRRVIAVAGNHDIGYAGDINRQRIERFEDAYGRVNWNIRFRLDTNSLSTLHASSDLDTYSDPELHLIILNSMNLDEPALQPELQQQSRDFVDLQLYDSNVSSSATGTILLTHIPFHKEAGVCADAPLFSYFSENQGGGIKEQNHLSKHASKHILDGLVRPCIGQSIVLNGHDHEGCDTFHYRQLDAEGESGLWNAKHYLSSSSEQANDKLLGLREITVRSMMGEFGGNAGLLSAWWDGCAKEWRYEYDTCALGVQHIWWAIHVLDIIVVVLGVASLSAEIAEAFFLGVGEKAPGKREGKVKKA